MVAEREAYHGRVFERRLRELGGRMADRMTEEFQKNVAYLRDTKTSDYEKLKRGATRFPNPEETIRPIFEFADAIKEDFQTKEMVQLFAQDELSTLKWQNALFATLTAMNAKPAEASAAA
jgi:rubrerythrin